MKFSLLFVSTIIILTGCKKNDFSGFGENTKKPLSDIAEIVPENLDLKTDINNNNIPDSYEDPTLVEARPADTTNPNNSDPNSPLNSTDTSSQAENRELGKLYVPDGEGGFREITGAYKKTSDGIIKLEELLKEESGKFFQIENPNNDTGTKFIENTEGKDIPDGFEEASTIYINTPDGLKKLETGIFEPKTPNVDGSLTDPENLTVDNTANVNIIIPKEGTTIHEGSSSNLDGETNPGSTDVTGSSENKCDNHVAFLTSLWLTGSQVNPGGAEDLSGADKLCTDLAHKADLCTGNNFKAIISSKSTSVRDRITINGPVFNTAATKDLVASDRDQFWKHKGWSGFISFDESHRGVPHKNPSSDQRNNVWTNSNSEGFKMGQHCDHFSSNSGKGGAGSFHQKDDVMFDGSWWVRNCSEAKKIYCISQ